MKPEENKTIMSDSATEFMEAKNIAHMVGRMDAIIKAMEYGVLEIEDNKYLTKFLLGQINQAKDINEKIFEMHKKNELEKIKKTYNDEK